MAGYNFLTNTFRGRCVRVIDGDTIDVMLDCGFHVWRKERLRLLGIDTPELRSKDPIQRDLARSATMCVEASLYIPDVDWPLRIVTSKADSFGRYLAVVYFKNVGQPEVNLNDYLLRKNLAKVWKK